jgi:hypothetical protein
MSTDLEMVTAMVGYTLVMLEAVVQWIIAILP